MKTILVPTDYSETAKKAAIYAVNLASDLNTDTIILYNAYQAPPVIPETAVLPTGSMPYFDPETFHDISSKGMQQFKDSIQDFCSPNIKIETEIEYGDLNDINKICENRDIDLIVMGITGTSRIEEVLIGSTAISVVKNTKTPVIVVPANASYTSIKNVMLACDYKKVVETTPLQPIKRILDETKATLHVVNVYESDKKISADKTYQQELLHSLLKDYEPHFHFKHHEDFITGVNEYVDANNIDLIIVIPKKHTFFEGLFRERHAKKLAFHSHVPLMYIHQEDL